MTDIRIKPVARLSTTDERLVLYSDGEFVVVGQGDVYCSEHGPVAHDDIAAEQCKHERPDRPSDLPTLDLADVPNFVLCDREIQDAAVANDAIAEEVLLAAEAE